MTKSSKRDPRDALAWDHLDLMQYADGELEPELADALAEALAAEPGPDADGPSDRAADAREAREILAGLGEIRDLVRGRLELAADDAEPALDAMWSQIERRIRANGVPEAARSPEPSPALVPQGARDDSTRDRGEPARARSEQRAPRPAESKGLWRRFTDWFDAYRSHIMTGALTAGAVAALFLWLRPEPQPEQPPQPPVANVPRPTPMDANMVIRPRVESLEVPEGSSTVFTIPAEDEDDSGATVILVTFDEDDVEGPI